MLTPEQRRNYYDISLTESITDQVFLERLFEIRIIIETEAKTPYTQKLYIPATPEFRSLGLTDSSLYRNCWFYRDVPIFTTSEKGGFYDIKGMCHADQNFLLSPGIFSDKETYITWEIFISTGKTGQYICKYRFYNTAISILGDHLQANKLELFRSLAKILFEDEVECVLKASDSLNRVIEQLIADMNYPLLCNILFSLQKNLATRLRPPKDPQERERDEFTFILAYKIAYAIPVEYLEDKQQYKTSVESTLQLESQRRRDAAELALQLELNRVMSTIYQLNNDCLKRFSWFCPDAPIKAYFIGRVLNLIDEHQLSLAAKTKVFERCARTETASFRRFTCFNSTDTQAVSFFKKNKNDYRNQDVTEMKNHAKTFLQRDIKW